MTIDILRSRQGVTLVGAGHPSASDIEESLSFAPTLVAADGGADFCLDYNRRPEAIIGDFDSTSQKVRDTWPDIQRLKVTEQDTTDFEKCLTRIDAPFIIATGVTSGRIDHALAALSVLSRRVGPPTVILSDEEAIFCSDREVSVNLESGTRISLFPFDSLSGASEGLKWPINGLTLHPRGRVGTSNVATGPVHLTFDQPGCLILIPKAALAAALTAVRTG